MAAIGDVPSELLPSPFRSLAITIAGLELGAVLLLLLAALGYSPGDLFGPLAPIGWRWVPTEWNLVAFATYVALIAVALAAAYALGLLADAAATRAWILIGRTERHPETGDTDDSHGGFGDEGRHVLAVDRELEDWHLIRSKHYFVPGSGNPWIRTQRRIWESEQAASEFADLQMRLQLSQATWLNAVLLSAVALLALLFTAPSSTFIGAASFSGLGFWGGWMVLTHPPKLGNIECYLGREPDRRVRFCGGLRVRTWGWMVLGFAVLGFTVWALSCPAGLCVVDQAGARPEGWGWRVGNSTAAFLSALLAVGFAYVRAGTNALYHRHVRDAYRVETLESD